MTRKQQVVALLKNPVKTEASKTLARAFVDNILVHGRLDRLARYFDGDHYVQHDPQTWPSDCVGSFIANVFLESLMLRRLIRGGAMVVLVATTPMTLPVQGSAPADWPSYNRTVTGDRFSPLTEVKRAKPAGTGAGQE